MNDGIGALRGQTALITGGARRVGAALARALHAAGADIVIHYHRSRDDAQTLAAQFEATRPRSALALGADLLDVAQLAPLIARTQERFGALNILINNASSFYPTPLGQITLTQWEDLIGTNLRAPLFLAQAAAPALRASGGLLLNIADIHGMRPLRDHSVYCAAKAGLIMLTRALARELAPQVRVNAIAPGPVLWPEAGMEPELEQKIIARTPLGRAGSPQDIARAALFFAREAPYVTGQILAVDGGRSVGW
jgi:pteridine reductase